MKTVHIRESLKVGWETFKRKFWFLLGFALVFVPLLMGVKDYNFGLILVSTVLYGGFILMCLKHYYGEQVVADDLFSLDSRFISFVFLVLIKYSVIFLVGTFVFELFAVISFPLVGVIVFLFTIFPVFYLATRWMFADILVVDQGLRPIHALIVSGNMVKGNFWKLLFWKAVIVAPAFLLLSIGFGAVVIYAVLVAPVFMLASIKMYQDLRIS